MTRVWRQATKIQASGLGSSVTVDYFSRRAMMCDPWLIVGKPDIIRRYIRNTYDNLLI